MNSGAEQLSGLIVGTSLSAFVDPRDLHCNACGRSANLMDRLRGWVTSTVACIAEVHFCNGGKEPTSPLPIPQQIVSGRTDHVNECAGVSEPHLHVTCRMCRAGWLMKTKERIR